MEDDFNNVLEKSIDGQGRDLEELSKKSGVELNDIQSLLNGAYIKGALEKVGDSLGLNGKSLEGLAKGWSPKEVQLPGLECFVTQYWGMEVNAFVIDSGKEAAIFDTGGGAKEIIKFLKHKSLEPKFLFITHTHRDHIAAVGDIQKKYPDINLIVGEKEPLKGAKLVKKGDSFRLSRLDIEIRETSGHSPGGVTYVIAGLERKVAIAGDAIFSGSIGRANNAYHHALEQVRDKILTLPADTIICPGHGPMTTVAEEKAHNPFFS